MKYVELLPPEKDEKIEVDLEPRKYQLAILKI